MAWLVADVGVEGEVSEEFGCVGLDDADVEIVNGSIRCSHGSQRLGQVDVETMVFDVSEFVMPSSARIGVRNAPPTCARSEKAESRLR